MKTWLVLVGAILAASSFVENVSAQQPPAAAQRPTNTYVLVSPAVNGGSQEAQPSPSDRPTEPAPLPAGAGPAAGSIGPATLAGGCGCEAVSSCCSPCCRPACSGFFGRIRGFRR